MTYVVRKNEDKQWYNLILRVYICLISSDLIKWFTASQTETQKVRNDHQVTRNYFTVFKTSGKRTHRETGRQTSYQEHWLWKPHINLFATHSVIHFFHHSCTIQQSFSNKRPGMGRTNTLLQSVPIHFREWNCTVIGLGELVPSAPRLREKYRNTSISFLEYYGPFQF